MIGLDVLRWCTVDDDSNWLVTTGNDWFWWVMVEEGVWLQHMIGLDVLRW